MIAIVIGEPPLGDGPAEGVVVERGTELALVHRGDVEAVVLGGVEHPGAEDPLDGRHEQPPSGRDLRVVEEGREHRHHRNSDRCASSATMRSNPGTSPDRNAAAISCEDWLGGEQHHRTGPAQILGDLGGAVVTGSLGRWRATPGCRRRC
jgi:hypothetical protein